MDQGRAQDLLELDRQRNDVSLPMHRRKRAHRTFARIQRQIRDKKLTTLRHRMIKAKAAGDFVEGEKIADQINEYTRREYGYI